MMDGNVGHNFERTIPAKCGLIWFSSLRREDLNVKAYDVLRTDAK